MAGDDLITSRALTKTPRDQQDKKNKQLAARDETGFLDVGLEGGMEDQVPGASGLLRNNRHGITEHL